MNGNAMSDWNNTDCSMYEVDPYDETDPPTGFNIDECEAKLRFERML